MKKPHTETLNIIYDILLQRYGPQHWWPGDTAFEVMVDAVLTQSAAWTNVEKAIANLKAAGMLSPEALRKIEVERLAKLVYPSGYFNAKAAKLKALVNWYGSQYGDDLQKLRSQPAQALRDELLTVYGIGEETADSILLYAVDKPSFVIDAYARRIFQRLGIIPPNDTYADWRDLFMENLKPEVKKFKEYHALVVRHGKEVCFKREPDCVSCCLREICSTGKRSAN
ncbi:MAG: endonuclease [Dehalococcoidia bacterium]|nr:endonuclease [Dehalococcoidia bacterium]